MTDYYLDPKKGIYSTSKGYYDDIDYHYAVDFDKPDPQKQFLRFIETIQNRGKKQAIRELKDQFRGLRELLS